MAATNNRARKQLKWKGKKQLEDSNFTPDIQITRRDYSDPSSILSATNGFIEPVRILLQSSEETEVGTTHQGDVKVFQG